MPEFMIFRQPKTAMKPRKSCTVVDFRKSPGSHGIDDMAVLKDDGKLSLTGEFGDFRIFTFSGTCYTQKPGVAKTAPEAVLSFKVWQQKNGELVSIFASRTLARAVAPLLSFATFGKPDFLKEIGVEREDYIRMVNGIIGREGKINWVSFRGVQTKDVKIKRLEAIGPNINRLSGFGEMLEDPSVKVQKMGFAISGIMWTIADWGGGQILSPHNPQSDDLMKFCDIIDDFLFKHLETGERTEATRAGKRKKRFLGY